ncbi:MAG: hypothetical protein LBT89_05235, partial [Planctomycetaceae bacterium]|nr:hypothetical protein [Planctomycetaceae bacterium]
MQHYKRAGGCAAGTRSCNRRCRLYNDSMERIAWHPAFVQAIQLELADYKDVLEYESEYQLTSEPLKIDVLIIKKRSNVVIKKNIGQIFKQCNVVEYKSPDDRFTIWDYHKTQC